MEIFGIYVDESYIIILYILHMIISTIISFAVMLYIKRRYKVQTEEARANDKKRLEAIAERSLIFKLLFRISLHKYNPVASFVFFFIFNYSMPVFGYIASLWFAYYLVHVKYEHKIINTNILNLDEFETSFLKVHRIFGEGSMTNVILAEDVPKSKKLKALSSLSSNISPTTLRIIKQTLSSKNDEIRMYGYAIINKIEKKLNENINKHLEIYNNEKLEDSVRFEAAKELAFFYWEMVYAELSHESLRDSFINEVIKYLNIAKEYYIHKVEDFDAAIRKEKQELRKISSKDLLKKEDIEEVKKVEANIASIKKEIKSSKDISAKLYVLMGRVYMMRKEYENAVEEFTLAKELSSSDFSFVLPYLAEIYFILGKYMVAKSILKQAKSLDLNPKLYPIVAQWRS